MLPFITTLLGYLNHNWYPASVFGGDILPYYSGMTLAVAAMLVRSKMVATRPIFMDSPI